MITHEKILDSIKYVVDNSKYVNINQENMDNVIPILKENKNEPSLLWFLRKVKFTIYTIFSKVSF